MPIMRFTMTKSTRVRYLGHADTYDIQGADQVTQEWLQDWDRSPCQFEVVGHSDEEVWG